MSKLICASAIDGAIAWVARAEAMLEPGHRRQGRVVPGRLPRHRLLPARHLLLHRREGARRWAICAARPEAGQGAAARSGPPSSVWLPYLGNALDAGVAALFACEIIEACKYLDRTQPGRRHLAGRGQRRHHARARHRVRRRHRPRLRRHHRRGPDQRRSPSRSPGTAGEEPLRLHGRLHQRQAVRRAAGRGGRPARLGDAAGALRQGMCRR